MSAIDARAGGLTIGAVLGFGFGALILGALAWAAVTIITRRRERSRRALGSGRR
jgi:hypothetical protein